ncbi:transmembrane protein, putative, partial [Bodo saltans]
NNITGPVPYNWGGLFRRANFSIDLCFNSICGPLPKTLPSSNNSGFFRCQNSPLLTIGCYSRSATLSQITPTSRLSRSLTLTNSFSASPSSSPTGALSRTRNLSETLSDSIILIDSSADSFSKGVKDLTATASALTSVLAAADISNVNTLVLMAYVDCTVNGKKSIDSMRDGTFSSYMISPFMDVGWAAVAWGNLALGALALLLNAVVTAVVTIIDARRRSELSGDLQAPRMHIANAFYATVMGDVSASTVFPPFPGISIRFVELWTSGSVLGAFAEL